MRDLPRSSAAIEQAAALAGPNAAVRGMLALAGGTHARTYLIQTADPEREFILRQFAPGDDAARREMRVLAALDGLGGLTPRLLAGHRDGPRVPNYHDLGRADLTARVLRKRHTEWTRQLLGRSTT
jgi:Phosphotransferase enzyme family